jgi:hypothetical protein
MNDSFSTMLGSTEIPASDAKKKKDQKPVIKLDSEVSKQLKIFVDKKKEMKTAEGEMRIAEGPVLEVCQKRMDTDALDTDFDFHSSYEVRTEDGITKVSFITVDKFNLSQEPENIQALRDLLGDAFDKEIIKVPTVTLKPEVLGDEKLKIPGDEKLQKELVALLGKKFGKFFQTTVKYTTKPGFDERMYKIAGKAEKATLIRNMCGKNKAFFK